MNTLDFEFENSPWDIYCRTLKNGATISASRFLAMTEELTEDAFEDALADLEEKNILPDTADLPRPVYSTQSDLRLKREEDLVRQGSLPGALEENDPLRLYLDELSCIPAFGDPDVVAMEVLAGHENAKTQLMNLMLHKVLHQSFANVGKGVLLLDLMQEGSLGLWQAILDYRGGDVETYCDRKIAISLAKLIVSQAHSNGIGQKLKGAMEDYKAVDERLLGELGRNPTLEEIALELHISPDEASSIADAISAARLVNKAKAEPQEEKNSEDDDKAVEDTAYFQMRQRISELLSSLDPEDAQIISLRFGLEGGLPLSPADTGKKLNLTPEAVSEREIAALRKLRLEK